MGEINFDQFHIEIKNQHAKPLSSDDRRISLISFVLYIINAYLQKSFRFNTLFARHSGIEAHLRFLRNDAILERISNVEIIDMADQSIGLVDYVLTNLSLMSKNFKQNPHRWKDANALETILKVLETRSDDISVDAYVAIANIVTDAQIETLPAIHDCIDVFINMAAKAAQDFSIGK